MCFSTQMFIPPGPGPNLALARRPCGAAKRPSVMDRGNRPQTVPPSPVDPESKSGFGPAGICPLPPSLSLSLSLRLSLSLSLCISFSL